MNFDDYERLNRNVYKDFASYLESRLKEEIAKTTDLSHPQSTQSREKDPVSLKAKLEDRGILNSQNIESVIKDLAGVRLIFYTDTDVNRFLNSRLITQLFLVDSEQTRIHHPTSENEHRLYQAIHFIVSLSEKDSSLSQLQHFRGLRCEIQIQTILNHAWAETHHDMVYKAKMSAGYGTTARDALDRRLKRVMEEYLRPAAYEIQKAQHDHERLMQGKLLFERGVLEELKHCTDNNERHEKLESVAEYVLPNYDDHASVYPDIRDALLVAVRAARITPIKPISSPFGDLEGKSSKDVAIAAVGILDTLRFVDIGATFRSFIDVYKEDEDVDIRSAVLRAVERLAHYDLNVWNQAGAHVQLVLAEILEDLTSAEKDSLRQVLIAVWREMLKPDMEGTTSTAWDRIDLKLAAVPVTSKVEILREKAISGLISLFDSVASLDAKNEVLSALTGATRFPPHTVYSNEFCRTVLQNTLTIVRHLTQRAVGQPYEILQSIENDFHFSYVRARQLGEDDKFEARESAENLQKAITIFRDLINADRQYVHFKTLVGLEAVFSHEWDGEPFDYAAVVAYREHQISSLINEISEETAADWFQLIAKCAAVRSRDMLTFNILGKFLYEFARAKPVLAGALVDSGNAEVMNFLAAILKGLYDSNNRDEYSRLKERYLRDNANLPAIARHCRFTGREEVSTVEIIVHKAIATKDTLAVSECLTYAVQHHNPEDLPLIDRIFIPAIGHFGDQNDTRWINGIWYLPEAEGFFSGLAPDVVLVVLDNLKSLTKIDSHSETILAFLANNNPALIWSLLKSRFGRVRSELKDYQAIPPTLHSLREALARDASLAVRTLRQWYQSGDHEFRFKGGRLLHTVFPQFDRDLATGLLETIADGSEDDYDFAIALLTKYNGEPSTHPVVQELIERLPEKDPRLKQLDKCLRGTGPTAGPFGVVEAYRQKKAEMAPWINDKRAKVREFAATYINRMDQSIAHEQRFAENDLELQRRG